jgi:hypothetical protein
VVIPFLIFRNPDVAVRVSNLVALTQLFLLHIMTRRASLTSSRIPQSALPRQSTLPG